MANLMTKDELTAWKKTNDAADAADLTFNELKNVEGFQVIETNAEGIIDRFEAAPNDIIYDADITTIGRPIQLRWFLVQTHLVAIDRHTYIGTAAVSGENGADSVQHYNSQVSQWRRVVPQPALAIEWVNP